MSPCCRAQPSSRPSGSVRFIGETPNGHGTFGPLGGRFICEDVRDTLQEDFSRTVSLSRGCARNAQAAGARHGSTAFPAGDKYFFSGSRGNSCKPSITLSAFIFAPVRFVCVLGSAKNPSTACWPSLSY